MLQFEKDKKKHEKELKEAKKDKKVLPFAKKQ